MRTIKLFISSPGDVAQEREICRRILSRLNREFTGRMAIDGYFWEYEPMEITQDYQEQIPSPSSFDIFICILWTRLGSRLHSKYRLPDGRPCRSGTEFEFVDALEGRKRNPGTPEFLVWVNKTKPMIPLEPEEEYEQRIQQWRSLKSFLDEWTRGDNESVFTGAVNSYRSLDKFEELLEIKLRKLVERRLGGETEGLQLPPAQWKQGSPYRGLEAFGKEHADVFFGRTGAIEAVLNAVRRQADDGRGFVLVLGASGSGKSSLVSAGVLPLLTTPGVIEGIGLWREAKFRPGLHSDSLLGLVTALLEPAALPELADPEASDPAQLLTTRLREAPGMAAESVRLVLNEAARAFHSEQQQRLRDRVAQMEAANRPDDAAAIAQRIGQGKPPRARLLLELDQLEELFTGSLSESERQAFIAVLGSLASDGRVVILASLRSDFYHLFQGTPGLLALTGEQGKVDVLPPDAHEIGQIIREPARMAGLVFEKDAKTGSSLDEILRDAALRHPEALPLLEHALDQLYECQSKREDRTLRFADYEAIGEFDGALARHADAVFNGLSSEAQEAFDRVLRGLITLGREDHIPVRRSALQSSLAVDAASEELLNAFIDQRLFTTGQATRGEPVVAVAHEALLRVWDRTRDWIAVNEDFLASRARIGDACQAWLAAGRDESFLLQPGRQLAEGEDVMAKHGEAFSSEEHDFVQASRDRFARDERRRQRLRNTVLAVMTVLTLLALIGFFHAQQKRQEATAAAQSEIMAREKAQRVSDSAVGFMNRLLGENDWTLRLQEDNAVLASEFFDVSGSFMEKLAAEDEAPELLDSWSRLLTGSLPVLLDTGDREAAFAAQAKAQGVLEQLADSMPNNAAIQVNLVKIRFFRGQLHLMAGEAAKAASAYREGAAAAEKFLEASDDFDLRYEWLGCYLSLSETELQHGDAEASRSQFDHLLGKLETWSKNPEQDVLWSGLRVDAWVRRSDVYVMIGDHEGAAQALTRAAEWVEQVENETATKILALRLQRAWGFLEWDRKAYAKAVVHLRAWLDGQGEIPPQNPKTKLEVIEYLTTCLTRLGRWNEALEAAGAAREMAEAFYDRDPNNLSNMEKFIRIITSVGELYQTQERWADAVRSFAEAQELAIELVGRADEPAHLVRVVDLATRQGLCLSALNDSSAALEVLTGVRKFAVQLGEALALHEGHPSLQLWKQYLAYYHAQLGYSYVGSDGVQAREAFRAALKWSEGDALLQPVRAQWSEALEKIE